MISPHGGTLVSRMVPASERDAMQAYARTLPVIDMNAREASDLLADRNRRHEPPRRFHGPRCLRIGPRPHAPSVRACVWSLPVTLGVSDAAIAQASARRSPRRCARRRDTSPELFRWKSCIARTRRVRQRSLSGPAIEAHPGVQYLKSTGDTYAGGKVWLLERVKAGPFAEPTSSTPRETRALFAEKKWERVCAFQTRNPIHRAHEYLIKCALEIVDGFLIHPAMGETKSDDVPARRAWSAISRSSSTTSPPANVALAAFPYAMRYAGPREAILHALIRKNYGCTHFIVGRDHAGVGNYYGTYDAQKHLRDSSTPGEIAITPIMFEHSFYCRRCGGMASQKTCPHGAAEPRDPERHQGARDARRAATPLPEEFTRREVAAILQNATTRRARAGSAWPDVWPSSVWTASHRSSSSVRGSTRCRTCAASMQDGLHGRLVSTVPPITVPAWMAMMTSQDPGMLGIYGFRNRESHAYEDTFTVNATHVQATTVWNILSRNRLRSVVMGVPLTYPPKPLNGVLVGCFLTPDNSAELHVSARISSRASNALAGGEYIIDVKDFRNDDKQRDAGADRGHDRTALPRLSRHCSREEEWDFAMMVEMGPDRLHHAFWRYFDPGTSPVRDRATSSKTSCTTTISSMDARDRPHGRRAPARYVGDRGLRPRRQAHGGRNRASTTSSMREGYLALKSTTEHSPTRLKPDMVDWTRTTAWGDGGYYARVFLERPGPRAARAPSRPPTSHASARELARQARGTGRRERRTHRHARASTPRRSTANAAASRPTWSCISATSTGAARARVGNPSVHILRQRHRTRRRQPRAGRHFHLARIAARRPPSNRAGFHLRRGAVDSRLFSIRSPAPPEMIGRPL